MTYTVEIKDMCSAVVELEGTTEEDARRQALAMYWQGEIPWENGNVTTRIRRNSDRSGE